MWEIWLFTFGLGFLQFVKGVEFYRCIENHWFLQHFKGKLYDKVVLDIGPWKSPLASYLSRRHGTIQSVLDVDEGLMVQRKYCSEMRLFKMKYFELGEPIKLGFPSQSADIVTIISTIEHFPGDGDLDIMAEINRILVPDGAVYITVPYGPEYKSQIHYKWDEKTYNYEAIVERFHKNFIVEKEFFFKDSKTSRFTSMYWRLPRVVRFALGRAWILFASHYIKTDRATKDDASLYGVVLRKPMI